jgi:uncharacterized membrane protein YGL010W
MIDQPKRKITAGLLAGAVMTILAWTSKEVAGIEIPAEVALAGSTVITFLIQFIVPEASEETSDV